MTPRYRIRPAVAGDGPEFLRLLRELALFEKLDPPDAAAQTRLLEDAFGERPRFTLVVAEEMGTPRLAAYAVLLSTYSSFLAKPTLFIEDIYLDPAHRGNGLAQTMLSYIGRRAAQMGCGRIEGIVLDWNERARRFYAKTGAVEKRDWVLFRYDEAAIHALDQRMPASAKTVEPSPPHA